MFGGDWEYITGKRAAPFDATPRAKLNCVVRSKRTLNGEWNAKIKRQLCSLRGGCPEGQSLGVAPFQKQQRLGRAGTTFHGRER
jgi:hypothetical protein